MIFLENEILYGHSSPVPKLDDFVLPIGKAKIARAGNDVTIIAWSMGMNLETTEEELMHTIFPHPTLSEMMKEAVLDAYGRVLNM